MWAKIPEVDSCACPRAAPGKHRNHPIDISPTDIFRPRGRSSLIIPSGGAGLIGWANFRDTLSRIYAAEAQLSGEPVPPVPASGPDVSHPSIATL